MLELSQMQKIAYSYLLGLYLGDGYVNKMPRTYRLRISLHLDEVDIQNRALYVIRSITGKKSSLVYRKNVKCVDVSAYSNKMPILFPIGHGAKHLRKIKLEEWQEEILNRNSEYFIAGLFDSDGCAYTSSGKRQYQFTNKSLDILNLFMCYLKINNINVKLTPRGDGIYNIFIRKLNNVVSFEHLLNNAWNNLDKICIDS